MRKPPMALGQCGDRTSVAHQAKGWLHEALASLQRITAHYRDLFGFWALCVSGSANGPQRPQRPGAAVLGGLQRSQPTPRRSPGSGPSRSLSLDKIVRRPATCSSFPHAHQSINLFCLNHFHLPTDIHLGLFSTSLAGCFVDALAKPHPRFPVFCASPVLTTRR
ncbi:hypothetical protein ACQRIU_000942 [Beauveria bassiana]